MAIDAVVSRLRVPVLEKEPGVGKHQTGHNSGVLHSGIYYKPGSLTRVIAARANSRCRGFVAEGIPYEICGKVIVAMNEANCLASRNFLSGVRRTAWVAKSSGRNAFVRSNHMLRGFVQFP